MYYDLIVVALILLGGVVVYFTLLVLATLYNQLMAVKAAPEHARQWEPVEGTVPMPQPHAVFTDAALSAPANESPSSSPKETSDESETEEVIQATTMLSTSPSSQMKAAETAANIDEPAPSAIAAPVPAPPAPATETAKDSEGKDTTEKTRHSAVALESADRKAATVNPRENLPKKGGGLSAIAAAARNKRKIRSGSAPQVSPKTLDPVRLEHKKREEEFRRNMQQRDEELLRELKILAEEHRLIREQEASSRRQSAATGYNDSQPGPSVEAATDARTSDDHAFRDSNRSPKR